MGKWLTTNATEVDRLARNVMVYIRMHFKTGDKVDVRYRRGDKDLSTSFKLRRKPW